MKPIDTIRTRSATSTAFSTTWGRSRCHHGPARACTGLGCRSAELIALSAEVLFGAKRDKFGTPLVKSTPSFKSTPIFGTQKSFISQIINQRTRPQNSVYLNRLSQLGLPEAVKGTRMRSWSARFAKTLQRFCERLATCYCPAACGLGIIIK
jgi:hypothetical protein